MLIQDIDISGLLYAIKLEQRRTGAPGVSARSNEYWEHACLLQGLCWRHRAWCSYGEVLYMYTQFVRLLFRAIQSTWLYWMV